MRNETPNSVIALVRRAEKRCRETYEQCKDSDHPAIRETAQSAWGKAYALQAVLQALQGGKNTLRLLGDD